MTAPPVTSEVLGNGAAIAFDPLLRKYAVVDAAGHLHGYRHNVAEARELAASIPGPAVEEPEPAPIARSPKAMPVAETQYLPMGVPRDERVDLFAPREPRVVGRGGTYLDAVIARQRRAFDAVYGRHVGRR